MQKEKQVALGVAVTQVVGAMRGSGAAALPRGHQRVVCYEGSRAAGRFSKSVR